MMHTLLLLLERGASSYDLPLLMRTYRQGGADTVVMAQQQEESWPEFLARIDRRVRSLARDGRSVSNCVLCPKDRPPGPARAARILTRAALTLRVRRLAAFENRAAPEHGQRVEPQAAE